MSGGFDRVRGAARNLTEVPSEATPSVGFADISPARGERRGVSMETRMIGAGR